MAEEKSEKKSEAWAPASPGVVFSEIIGAIILLFIIGTLVTTISSFLNPTGNTSGVSVPWYERFTEKGKLIAHSRPLSTLENPIGMRVVSITDNDIYDSPGGNKIGSHKFGDAGRVIQGPVEVNGVKYWYVDYDNPPDGWVKEDDVRSLTVPVSSLADPIGQTVMNTKDGEVIGEYGGVLGTHKAGDKGKIVRGPKYINGEKYWYVDYEDGADGWVRESDLGIIQEDNVLERFLTKVFSIGHVLLFVALGIAILGFIALIYLWTKINEIYYNERKLLYPEAIESSEYVKNTRWERVVGLVDSLNENDWRLAIIEADIMLADLLEKMMLPGDTIGDKLKLIEKSDFNTLDAAWEAHKMRNAIAHQGTNFLLTQREARRIISLYESVFSEFQMI